MHARDLLFCLDDNPSDIQKIDSDLPTFTADECAEVTAIVSRLFETHGDMIHEFAFDVVSLTFHTRQERAAIKLMYG